MFEQSRTELLKKGGLYPILVPLGWKLIGSAGEDIAIPLVAGLPFHRILARGALLATETNPGMPPEVMTARHYRVIGPVTNDVRDQYAAFLVDALANKGLRPRLDDTHIGNCALSLEQCVRVTISRMAPGDGRIEVHYLVRDQRHQPWELTYLIRAANVERWRPLFAELEHQPTLGVTSA